MLGDLFNPAPDPLIGRKLDGRYEVLKRLGEGGAGVVYQGRQAQLGRFVAIKVLHQETAASPEWGGRPDKPRDEDYPVTQGPGLFTETLLGLLGDERPRVRSVGIGQDLFDYDEGRELAKLAGEL